MTRAIYLLVHKDHTLHVRGVNSGAEMASLFLARFLAKAGKKIIVAGMLDEPELSAGGVEFWDTGAAYNTGSVLKRARELGEYHLISAGRALPLMQAAEDPRCLSRTLITHDRSGNDTGISPSILTMVADHIVCVSNAQREVILSSGADPAKVTVIHNGADLEIFQPGDPETRDYRKLVFVGALIQDKGIHVLLSSYAQLKARFPDLTLDIYGSADLWGRERMFDERKVEQQLPGVHFHGKTSQGIIADAYRSAGICVIPSIWFDPFPLVALEAQVTGCPVVAFNVGGLGEGMIPGKTGVLLDEISESALVNCLSDLLSRPERLKGMSREALTFARKAFTWDRVASEIISLCSHHEPAGDKEHQDGPVGILTTWNQQCGLATYARYFVEQMPKGAYFVLAEDTQAGRTGVDEDFVIRCWKKEDPDFSHLLKAVREKGIRLLHLNCQARFFAQPQFSAFLNVLRAEGVTVLSHLHNTYTLDQSLQQLMKVSDAVIVHTEENRLEAVANGAPAEKTFVLEHGVDVRRRKTPAEHAEIRTKFGLPLDEKVITCFGFVQPHKGMEGMIEAVMHLHGSGVPSIGVIAGRTNPSDPGSAQYMAALKEFAQRGGVSDRIRFLDRFLDDEEVMEYLAVSDVVMMNYHSNYFEASGACALAIGAGAVVAASIAPPFMSFGDAVWHMTGGYPPALSIQILLTNECVRDEVRKRAEAYCHEHSWAQTTRKLLGIYEALGFQPDAHRELKETVILEGFPVMGSYDCADFCLEYQELVEKGELAAREGNLPLAHELLSRARHTSTFFERAATAQAAVFLAEGKVQEAREMFLRALEMAPDEVRALSGMGLCHLHEGRVEDAYNAFLSALRQDPCHILSLSKLVGCAHELSRFEDLERALRIYLIENPEDADMLYCYAGCLCQEGKFSAANDALNRLEQCSPGSAKGRELKELIGQRVH